MLLARQVTGSKTMWFAPTFQRDTEQRRGLARSFVGRCGWAHGQWCTSTFQLVELCVCSSRDALRSLSCLPFVSQVHCVRSKGTAVQHVGRFRVKNHVFQCFMSRLLTFSDLQAVWALIVVSCVAKPVYDTIFSCTAKLPGSTWFGP